MNKRKMTLVALVLIVMIGILYFGGINKNGVFLNEETIGFNYYPNILFTCLIILCIISFLQTLKRKGGEVITINKKLLFFTVGFTLIYLLSWRFIGFFYINTFLFLLVLLFVYRKKDNYKRLLTVNTFISLTTTITLYIFFSRLMNIQF